MHCRTCGSVRVRGIRSVHFHDDTRHERAERKDTDRCGRGSGKRFGSQTAVVAEAENASDQNGIVTTDVNIGSTAEANEATEQETGKTLTVQEVAANVMPAMVAITSTTVEEVNDYFGGLGGYGFFGGFGQGGSDTIESVGAGSGEIIGETDDQLIIATNQQ